MATGTWARMLERNRERQKAKGETMQEQDKRPEFDDHRPVLNTFSDVPRDDPLPPLPEDINPLPKDYLLSSEAKAIVRAIESLECAIRSKARSVAGEQYVEAFEKRMERRFTEITERETGILNAIGAGTKMQFGMIEELQSRLRSVTDQLFERIPEDPPFERASTDPDFQKKLDDAIASKRKFKIVVEGEPERLVLLPTVNKRRNP